VASEKDAVLRETSAQEMHQVAAVAHELLEAHRFGGNVGAERLARATLIPLHDHENASPAPH